MEGLTVATGVGRSCRDLILREKDEGADRSFAGLVWPPQKEGTIDLRRTHNVRFDPIWDGRAIAHMMDERATIVA